MRTRIDVYFLTFILSLGILPLSAYSINIDDKLNINGFITTGITKSTEKDGIYKPGSKNITNQTKYTVDTRAGLQLTASLHEDISATIQLLGEFDNESEQLDIEAEWAFIRYNITENSFLRAGRVRLPMLQFSETQAIGYSYLWTRPPEEIMEISPADLLDGLDLIYEKSLFDGDYSFRAQFLLMGTNPGVDNKMGLRDVSGLGLTLESDYYSIRLGGGIGKVDDSTISSEEQTSLNTLYSAFANPALAAFGYNDIADYFDIDGKSAAIYTAGLNVDYEDWLLFTEYAYRTIDDTVVTPKADAFYITVGKRFGKWTPHLTYSKFKTSKKVVDDISSLPILNQDTANLVNGALVLADTIYAPDQHSITLGIKYVPSPGFDIKFDIIHVSPDNGGNGFFKNGSSTYDGSDTTIFNVAFDIVF